MLNHVTSNLPRTTTATSFRCSSFNGPRSIELCEPRVDGFALSWHLVTRGSAHDDRPVIDDLQLTFLSNWRFKLKKRVFGTKNSASLNRESRKLAAVRLYI